MAVLSRNQKRRKKLAERERRRANRHMPTDVFDSIVSQIEDTHNALAAMLNALAPGEKPEVAPMEDQLLLAAGAVHNRPAIQTVTGQQHQCHKNCAFLFWLNQPSYQIATGYAYLKSMGRWVRHSWLMNDTTILETTHPRDIYFGVVLDGVGISTFFVNHILGVLEECRITVEVDPTGQQVLLTMPAGA